jgi:peptidoglycan/LPS O-acetylase OafA/YrhL
MLITVAATLAIAAFPFFAPDPFCGNLGLTCAAMLGVLLVWLASLERGLVFEIPIVSSILEYIGSRSYSMYLAHIAILVIMLHNANHYGPIFPTWLLTSSMGGVALFMIFVSLTTLAAEVSYRWIEKPIIEYGKIKIARSLIYSRQSTSYETQASKVPGN